MFRGYTPTELALPHEARNSPCREARQVHEAHLLAYFPQNFFHAAAGQREDIETVQELLRHANSRITLDIYTQAVTPAKRAAQTKVVEMIVRKPKQREQGTEEVRVSLSNLPNPCRRGRRL
jgi:hypothetical protein